MIEGIVLVPGALGWSARKREWIAGGNSSLGPTFGWFGWTALGTYQWARDLGAVDRDTGWTPAWPLKISGIPKFIGFSKHKSFLYYCRLGSHSAATSNFDSSRSARIRTASFGLWDIANIWQTFGIGNTRVSQSVKVHQTLEWINGYLGDSNDSLSKSTLKIHLRICEPSCATSIKNFPSNDVEKSKFLNPKFFFVQHFCWWLQKKGCTFEGGRTGKRLRSEASKQRNRELEQQVDPWTRLFGWIKLQMVHIYKCIFNVF